MAKLAVRGPVTAQPIVHSPEVRNLQDLPKVQLREVWKRVYTGDASVVDATHPSDDHDDNCGGKKTDVL